MVEHRGVCSPRQEPKKDACFYHYCSALVYKLKTMQKMLNGNKMYNFWKGGDQNTTFLGAPRESAEELSE